MFSMFHNYFFYVCTGPCISCILNVLLFPKCLYMTCICAIFQHSSIIFSKFECQEFLEKMSTKTRELCSMKLIKFLIYFGLLTDRVKFSLKFDILLCYFAMHFSLHMQIFVIQNLNLVL